MVSDNKRFRSRLKLNGNFIMLYSYLQISFIYSNLIFLLALVALDQISPCLKEFDAGGYDWLILIACKSEQLRKKIL